jgi:transposase
VTPVIRHFYRHDRLSVISGLSVSPGGRRLQLYFRIHERNISGKEVLAFLRQLLKSVRGPIVVVWDNIKTRGGASIRDFCRRVPRLHLERFPAYAPELNPDEGIWAQAKCELANAGPNDLRDLSTRLRRTLRGINTSQRKLRACVHRSALPPFLN